MRFMTKCTDKQLTIIATLYNNVMYGDRIFFSVFSILIALKANVFQTKIIFKIFIDLGAKYISIPLSK